MLFLSMIQSLGESERECAERIFLDYGEKIYAIALKITQNRHDAEDVLDSVMINVMKNINKFSGKPRNETDAQIVIYSRNEAINLYRKKKRRLENEVALSDFDEDSDDTVADGSFETERIVINEETTETVRKYLTKLPPEYEEILRLVYKYGYSHAEIATLLHISENAVTMKVYRAKKKLKELSGDELYECTKN